MKIKTFQVNHASSVYEVLVKAHGGKKLKFVQPKIVHIKRAKTKNGSINVYWNNTSSTLLTGSKVCFDKGPIPSISHIMPARGLIDDSNRKHIQLGDSVVYLLNFQAALFLCATVVGFKRENSGKYKNYILLQPNHPGMDRLLKQSLAGKDAWFPIDDAHIVLASNNLKPRAQAEKNCCYAQYQDELEIIEQLYAIVRVGVFFGEKIKRDIVINEKLWLECNEILFGKVYEWAGHYRKHEVVVAVGRREHPTSHPDNIKDELSLLFRRTLPSITRTINNYDKNKLTEALVVAHKYLAKIHPFEDGNGRTIRLFLKIMAQRWGHELLLEEYLIARKQKRYYHYAIGKLVKGCDRDIKKIILRSLKPLD